MLSNVDDLELLRHEFNAGNDSFLIQLHVDLHWDRRAFNRLEQAMRRVCAQDLRWRLFGTRSSSGGRAARTWI
jgi:hypothetical protein